MQNNEVIISDWKFILFQLEVFSFKTVILVMYV